MTVEGILVAVHNRWRRTGKIPHANDTREMGRVAREASRKIGSWRRTLWMANVLKDQRRGNISPPMDFFKDGQEPMGKQWRIVPPDLDLLRCLQGNRKGII